MCGIVGLFIKDPSLEPELGRLTAGMLATMSDRGPDSAGFAVYGAGDDTHTKLTLRGPSAAAIKQVADKIGRAFSAANIMLHDTHAVVSIEDQSLPRLTEWLAREAPQIELVGKGLSVRQIAEQLCVSIKTVESHTEHIKSKLGLESSRELVRRAALWSERNVRM